MFYSSSPSNSIYGYCGYAVLYHGEARFTEDIDIILGVDNDDLSRILNIVSGDFQVRTKNPEKFVNQTNVLPLRETDSGIKVDLIFSFIEFEREAIRNAEIVKIEGNEVRIVKAEDLIIYKLLAGRPKDLEDAKNVLQLNETKIDLKKIDHSINEISEMMGNDSVIRKWNEIKDQSG
ncbi:MAG: nucleotidyl transferase AbiEii/AbiGii toxin family protein [Gracilimonas sp.]|uniref:nucleotidyl transferase AbiEii/AbiGii toxin family protein n=1 Tax=Gracilimonas sp. TaxID=1974203 RepID=UPI0019A808E5|nr:nucleotidyl transferase AbiEii/AbiGii toxin family protein [Gracilimonas sp.]MBD3616687.1 nucleotidyl transferase AbiEii/AbiGii toxin family protein [Gracilimonas sp.]